MLLECAEKECRELNEVYRSADPELKIFLEEAIQHLIKRPDLPAEMLAKQLRIGRSTLFRRLKKLDIDYKLLRKAASYEHEIYLSMKGEGAYMCLSDYAYDTIASAIRRSIQDISSIIHDIELSTLFIKTDENRLHRDVHRRLKDILADLRYADRVLEGILTNGKECIRSPID